MFVKGVKCVMDGILPLWKERGMTSHDCVFKLRKILRTKKEEAFLPLYNHSDVYLPAVSSSITSSIDITFALSMHQYLDSPTIQS